VKLANAAKCWLEEFRIVMKVVFLAQAKQANKQVEEQANKKLLSTSPILGLLFVGLLINANVGRCCGELLGA